jgi:hypothetical protein
MPRSVSPSSRASEGGGSARSSRWVLVVVSVDNLVVVRLAAVGRLIIGLAVARGVVIGLVTAGRLVVGVTAAGRRDGGNLRPVWEDGFSCSDGFLPSGEFEWWIVFNGDWGFLFLLLLETLFGRGEEDALKLNC